MTPEHYPHFQTVMIPSFFTGSRVQETMGTISGLLAQHALRELALDFVHSELVDSSAIGMLVSLAREAHSRSVLLVLKNLSPDLTKLFCDTGLDRIFSIEHDAVVVEAVVDLFEPAIDIKLVITKEHVGSVCVFCLRGVMNHPVGSGYFKQQLLLSLAQSKMVLVDMDELTFFDSLSLSVVLSMNNLLVGTGGGMRICNANYIVLDLFETLNIGAIIPIFSSREEALSGWSHV